MLVTSHRSPGMRTTLIAILISAACSALISIAAASPDSAAKGESFDFNRLDAYIDNFNRTNGFSGAVLIAQEGRTVFQKVVGWQDVLRDQAIDRDTRFNLGSGNKMFTAIAIAQLAEQGKLNFDDPLILHLPDYPNRSFAKRATIHHLLTHSSGLANYWDDEYEQNWHRIRTLREMLPFFADDPTLFEPGDRHEYCNSGYIVLGLIIEQISGLSYYDYVRDNIYRPAGMTQSDSYLKDGSVPDLAIAYQGPGSKWHVATHNLKGTSAGGGYSTTDDMLKFHNALQNNLLIEAGSLELLQAGKVPLQAGSTGRYAYGFIEEFRNGHRHVGHGGRTSGVFFEYRYYPDLDTTLVFFSNSASGLPEVLFDRIDALVAGADDELSSSMKAAGESIDATVFRPEIVARPDGEVEITVLDSAPDDSARYWAVVQRWVDIVNDGDIESFIGLFADQDVRTLASNESMFSFMKKDVIPLRGKVSQLHELSPLTEVKGLDAPIRIATFHLEDGYPGYINLALNDEGKIEQFSLFVHERICPNGVTTSCPDVCCPVGE